LTKRIAAAEANLTRAQEILKRAEEAADAPEPAAESNAKRPPRTEISKEKAQANVTAAQTQLETMKSEAQAKAEAAERAEQEAKAAEAAREAAVEAASEASRQTSPVSVFISRKTQRLYVRQGYEPVYEGPVTIRDADKPIGSFVFTALGYSSPTDVRWSVVSMYKSIERPEPEAQQGQRRKHDHRGAGAVTASIAPANVAGAKAALDRITIPQETIERISEVVLPGSSLIISDEGISIETGKDTDFVILMSGEPQGGIKARKREPRRYRDDDDFWGSGKGGGGGFFSFWN
jgi:hypothetical protein